MNGGVCDGERAYDNIGGEAYAGRDHAAKADYRGSTPGAGAWNGPGIGENPGLRHLWLRSAYVETRRPPGDPGGPHHGEHGFRSRRGHGA